MRHGDPIIVKHINGIARRTILILFLSRTATLRLDSRDKDTADLKLTRTINNMRRALDCIRVAVTGSIVTDRHNVRAQLQGVIANSFTIEWIRHHGRVIAFRETKTGMSIPGNFHESLASKRILYPLLNKRSWI